MASSAAAGRGCQYRMRLRFFAGDRIPPAADLTFADLERTFRERFMPALQARLPQACAEFVSPGFHQPAAGSARLRALEEHNLGLDLHCQQLGFLQSEALQRQLLLLAACFLVLPWKVCNNLAG